MIETNKNISYAEIFSFANLYTAHLEARRQGRRKRDCIVKFEHDVLSSLMLLCEQLQNKTYRISKYIEFSVLDPKPRKIYALSYRDRIVLKALCDNFLYPLFANKLIYDNVACVKGKGQHFAIKRIKKFLRHCEEFRQSNLPHKDLYYLKVDIKKFYPSLAHEVIKQAMLPKIEDLDTKNIFEQFIDSFATSTENLEKYGLPNDCKRGIPIGNQSSQIIGLYYLDPLDRYIKEVLRIKHYIRYMDDFLIIHPDKNYLKTVLALIKSFLETKLKLFTNKKTVIAPVKKGVPFIGNIFKISIEGTVENFIASRTTKRFTKAVNAFNKNPSDYESEKIQSSVASYSGYCKHSKTKGKAKRIASKLNVSKKPKKIEQILFEISEDMDIE